MKTPRITLRHRLEFALLWIGIKLIRALPARSIQALAAVAGAIAFAAGNRRRDIACRNIRQAGICTSETDVRRVARAATIHFIHTMLSALRSTPETLAQTVIEEDIDPAARAALSDSRQGIILCSGHLGNWEIGLKAIARQFPLLGIARRMNNPLAENFLQWRDEANIEITPKHDQDAGRLVRALCEGRNLGILFDQHAPGNRGVMVPFFGIPAATYPSPAMLHLTTKAPICFASCIQTGPDAYRLRIDAPFHATRTGNRKADTFGILLQLHHRLETAIRETPGQYLWGHRRWRDQTDASTPDTGFA